MVYFVTAIHTNSGKTLFSAILTQALQADYWKPIQCGEPRDADAVKEVINNNHSLIHEEAYFLKVPMSPHAAAAKENKIIELDQINLPNFEDNDLVIEGAGGLLVPLNEEHYIIDLAQKFDAQVILVSNHYLGSINHTLLAINELKQRKLKVKGIVFNGEADHATENIILKKSGLKPLLRIEPEKEIDQFVVTKYAVQLFENWDE